MTELNTKAKTAKAVEGDVQEIFVNLMLGSINHKRKKNDKLDFIKMQKVSSFKGIVKKMKE